MASDRRQTARARQHQPALPAAVFAGTDPAQNVWQYLQQNFLSNRIYASYNAIIDACCNAWNALAAQAGLIASITTREWARSVSA